MAGASSASPTKPRPTRGFVVFKWTVYVLLGLNVLLYSRFGRATELLDTAAWVVLLMLFEFETGGWRRSAGHARALHAIRALAATGVLVAVLGYALERQWLDFANEATWLGVVVLLEAEVRLPPHFRRLHRWRRRLASVLYALLVAFLITWVVRGLAGGEPHSAWLDAWDAALWLVAFAVIELNVFSWARGRAGPG